MDEIDKLKAHIRELESRQKKAIEQLDSLANEQVHRMNGLPFSEVDIDDLEEVIAMLKGEE